MVDQHLDDPPHEPVAPFGALVGIGGGPHSDVLALPGLGVQLCPQQLGGVDLDDDLALEVLARIHVHVGVGDASKTVVTDDAVSEEVFSSRGHVKERELNAQWFNRNNLQWRLALDRLTVDRSLSRYRWIDRVKEPQMLSKTSEQAHIHDAPVTVGTLHYMRKSELAQARRDRSDYGGVGVGDAQDTPAVATLGIEDACQKPLAPVRRGGRRPPHELADCRHRGPCRGPYRIDSPSTDSRFLKHE